MKNTILITLMIITLASCMKAEVESNDSDNSKPVTTIEPIKSQVLLGQVHGQSWTFVSGRAKPSMFDKDSFSITLWEELVDEPCDNFSLGSERSLLTTAPMNVGEYDFSNTLNLTFVNQSENIISLTGKIIITEVSENVLKGKLASEFDSNNSVNGEFEVAICK